MKNKLSAAVIALLCAMPLCAQTQTTPAPVTKHAGPACAKEAQEFQCKGTAWATLSCLAPNIGKITNAACKEHVQKFIDADSAIKQACQAEIQANKCGNKDLGTFLITCVKKGTPSAACLESLPKSKTKK